VLHPLWLLQLLKDFKCGNCRRYPHSIVYIHSQAILPARGDRVMVRVEYGCRYCDVITPVAAHITNDEVSKLLLGAIRGGRFATAFRDPVPCVVLTPVSPSIMVGTPSNPIDATELERASRILKRTSFRRDSKTWKRFMDRLERGH
jgi:hypothetical protein